MLSIRRLTDNIKESEIKRAETNVYLFDTIPDFPEKQISPNEFRSLYDPLSVIYLNSKKLIDSDKNLYFYNAGIYENNDTTYRMFYRCGKNPKAYEDRVATCLLDKELNIISETNKYIDLHSCWLETTQNRSKIKRMIPFIFKNGTHVEDPRAIRVNNDWFVLYTDGIRMGIAKLNENCDKIYSHYLDVPEDITNKDHDGREKNWIPFIYKNGFIYILYSEAPRTYFKYADIGTSLVLVKTKTFLYNLEWKHGYIRGGCPPLPFENDKLIIFFHTAKRMATYVSPTSRVYMIGAYVTENEYPYLPIKISSLPILIGWPSQAIAKLILQDNVVFPCGAIQKNENTYIIFMGINDYKIGYLEINTNDLIWEVTPKTLSLFNTAKDNF